VRAALITLAMLGLSACATDVGSGSNAGVATYDDLKAAKEACAAKGGVLKLKRNGDLQYLGDYACEKAS